ncbi:DUF6289 family protein [Massilia sp. YIM B02443]|uniref:DUF6289 family protein n=1 Tax=Massilia sp. YIM B02443 TaxID=3050127 RepID=UPI0035A619C0
MKNRYGIMGGLALAGALFATAAYTAPAEREIIHYYDEHGIRVGYEHLGCNGMFTSWGVRTENYVIENYSCGNPTAPEGPPPPVDPYPWG